jgi:NTE family protein
MLVFQVDLFSSDDQRPHTITDVIAREKEIRFSSRTRQISEERIRRRQDRQAMRRVLDKLPPELADDPDVAELRARSTELPVNLVHLIYRAHEWESGARDFEFSARSMAEHWSAGQADVARTMAHAQLVAENILDGKSAAFDLSRVIPPPR